MSSNQPQFSGSIPDNYDRYLVPALFQPFAMSLAATIGDLEPFRVLELACGTGAVTRHLASHLPLVGRLVATDYSPDMLEVARLRLADIAIIDWKVADACALPFEDESFDAVACQFGAMMFPDKAAAMAEAYRVLVSGGHLIFSTWGPIEMNPVFQSIENTLSEMFPNEERPFMPTPFSMSDPEQHQSLAREAGFDWVSVGTQEHTISPYDPATLASGFALGTPLGVYLRKQGYDLDQVQAKLAEGFASMAKDSKSPFMQAIVCHAMKN